MWGRMASGGRLVIGLFLARAPVYRMAECHLGLSCGRQSCLQAAFQAAVRLWPIHGAQWGRQSCLQPPFRRLAKPLGTGDRRVSFGFVSCRYRDGKPEKFVRCWARRLKAGCTVESLVLAGKPHVGQDGILLPIGNRPLRVFIPFHRRKAHADRIGCPTMRQKPQAVSGQRSAFNQIDELSGAM